MATYLPCFFCLFFSSNGATIRLHQTPKRKADRKMTTLAFLLLLACAQTPASKTNEIRLPTLTIGTNKYANAVVTRKNALEAVFRYDGGIGKVKISELPEPLRSEWRN